MAGRTPLLSRREREIMDLLYARGRATVAEVMGALTDPPGYSAVRALLRILEQKGHVRHREEAGKYLYAPVLPRDKAAKSALARVLETFFDGSVEKAFAARLTDPSVKLSAGEYERLSALIEAARKRGE